MAWVRRRGMAHYVGKALKVLFLALIFVIIVSPLVWVVITSLKTKKEMYVFPVEYLPRSLYFGNYLSVFQVGRFGRYFLNSMLVALVAPFFSILFATMAAYILAKVRFRGSRLVMVFILMTQMLPTAGAYIPLYILMSRLNMVDNLWTVILIHMAGGIPVGTIMLQGFLTAVPDSLEEAALIDGCSRFRSFIFIVLPLMVTGMFTVFIFQFIGAWNDVYISVLYINRDQFRTLAVAIYSFVGKYDINWGTVSAGTIIALLPTMVLFGVMKDLFVEGIAAGAVKG